MSDQQAQELRGHIEAEERLGRELVSYAGRWVAVRDHAVVDSGEKLAPLVARCGPEVEVFRALAATHSAFASSVQVVERPDEPCTLPKGHTGPHGKQVRGCVDHGRSNCVECYCLAARLPERPDEGEDTLDEAQAKAHSALAARPVVSEENPA